MEMMSSRQETFIGLMTMKTIDDNKQKICERQILIIITGFSCETLNDIHYSRKDLKYNTFNGTYCILLLGGVYL